jgi:hypothetical protein
MRRHLSELLADGPTQGIQSGERLKKCAYRRHYLYAVGSSGVTKTSSADGVKVCQLRELGLFLSQHLTNHFALPIRDAISEKLLVQQNTFLVDKHIEGNHNIPTASVLNDLYPQKLGIARSYQRADAKEIILAQEKPF